MPLASRLAAAVVAEWGSYRCPCCDRVMHDRHVKLGRATPPDRRTRGHDQAIARGGAWSQWLFICAACNTAQGDLSFAVWVRKLRLAGDRRAPLVEAVAAFIEEWKRRKT